MRSYPILFCLAICLLFSACEILKNDSEDVGGKMDIYAGIYTQGIEDSNFNPCFNQDESWQFLEIKDTAFVEKIMGVEGNPIYMEIEGTPSSKGEFQGFYATYDRQITVEEVVAVGSLQENGCS